MGGKSDWRLGRNTEDGSVCFELYTMGRDYLVEELQKTYRLGIETAFAKKKKKWYIGQNMYLCMNNVVHYHEHLSGLMTPSNKYLLRCVTLDLFSRR